MGELKSVILVAIGAGLAAIAGIKEHVDPTLMGVAMLIIGGGLGISVPGHQRDPAARTRTTDEPSERQQSGR